ncbi:MAG: phasin family protein [Burkholderiales bacterium]
MPATTQNKFAESMQEQLAGQQAQCAAFANKAIESSMRLFELNLRVAKESLDEFTLATQQMLSAKSPQELFSLDQGKIRENFNRMLSYAGAVTNITANMQAELNRATQTQLSNTCNKATKMFEGTVASVPGNSQNPFEMIQSVMDNAKGGYEQWIATNRKFAEAMGANLNMMEPVKSAPSRSKAGK